MRRHNLIDIGPISNGIGADAYGGRIEAYAFDEIDCDHWFKRFSDEVFSAIGKNYLPVYRIGDGELRFLFGCRINWKSGTFRSALRYIRNELFTNSWQTSWGEHYPPHSFMEPEAESSPSTYVKYRSWENLPSIGMKMA